MTTRYCETCGYLIETEQTCAARFCEHCGSEGGKYDAERARNLAENDAKKSRPFYQTLWILLIVVIVMANCDGGSAGSREEGWDAVIKLLLMASIGATVLHVFRRRGRSE